MKKLMFGLAVAGLCTAVSAVESNIVGYQTQNFVSGKGKLTMVNVPFANVTDGTKGVSIEDLVIPEKHCDDDWEVTKCDQIWVFNTKKNGYDTFYWDMGDGETYDPEWYNAYEDGTFTDFYPNGLPEGAAFFFQNSEAKAKPMTSSGAVDSRDEIEIELVSGKGKLTMVGNPYPVATDIEAVSIPGKHCDDDGVIQRL